MNVTEKLNDDQIAVIRGASFMHLNWAVMSRVGEPGEWLHCSDYVTAVIRDIGPLIDAGLVRCKRVYKPNKGWNGSVGDELWRLKQLGGLEHDKPNQSYRRPLDFCAIVPQQTIGILNRINEVLDYLYDRIPVIEEVEMNNELTEFQVKFLRSKPGQHLGALAQCYLVDKSDTEIVYGWRPKCHKVLDLLWENGLVNTNSCSVDSAIKNSNRFRFSYGIALTNNGITRSKNEVAIEERKGYEADIKIFNEIIDRLKSVDEEKVEDNKMDPMQEFKRVIDAVTAEKDEIIADKDELIAEKDDRIAELELLLKVSQGLVDRQLDAIEHRDTTITEKDAAIIERDETIAEQDVRISQKDAIIEKQGAMVNKLKEQVNNLEDQIDNRDPKEVFLEMWGQIGEHFAGAVYDGKDVNIVVEDD